MNAVDALVDDVKRSSQAIFIEHGCGHGPGVHHGHVGPPLIKVEPDMVFGCMIANKLEEFEVPARITSAQIVQVENPEGEISMVVLDAFSPKLGAGIVFQDKRGQVEMGGFVCFLFAAIVIEKGLAAAWAFSVGTPSHLHLQYSQIDSHLDLLASVVTMDETHDGFIGVEMPRFEDVGDVVGHGYERAANRGLYAREVRASCISAPLRTRGATVVTSKCIRSPAQEGSRAGLAEKNRASDESPRQKPG